MDAIVWIVQSTGDLAELMVVLEEHFRGCDEDSEITLK